MTTKSKILKLLEENRGKHLSGENIATILELSRNSVWKAIKSLKEEGHQITAVTNIGYTLQDDSDKLSSFGISKFLNTCTELDVMVIDTIDSTITEAKRLLNAGRNKNFCLVAEQQTGGLGRRGKSFYSPTNGIYMSIAITGEIPVKDSQSITCNAAVAVSRAIEELSDDIPQIKWVNDILVNGKKVCGILTEGIFDFETNTMKSVIVGIGINCNIDRNDLPNELSHIVGDINLSTTRNKMIATVVNNFIEQMNFSNDTIMDEYKSRSMIIGKNITHFANNESTLAVVTDINSAGNLIATATTGEVITISSGIIEIEGLYK